MGREVAQAVPEAMQVFELGSIAAGLDLQRLCFEGSEQELVETEVQQPALVATSLAVLAGHPRAWDQARLRRRALRRRVRCAGRRGCVEGRRGDRARPRARTGDGRSRANEPRLDGRDPRARRRGRRADLPPHPQRVARELQLPRADRRLRRESGRGRSLPRRRGGRRAPGDQAAGVRVRSTAHSSRVPPTGCARRSSARSSRSRPHRSCRR